MQRKAETPWRHAWNTRGQTEEAVCEEGGRGDLARLQRRDREADSPTK